MTDLPMWQRAGFRNEADYEAAKEWQRAVDERERARAAKPRPVLRPVPMSGGPTLGDVAREDGEG
jgi:hypothetical protein